MKEITRITVAEITQVVTVDDEVAESMEKNIDFAEAACVDAFRHEIDADDVHVSMKLFIREVDE